MNATSIDLGYALRRFSVDAGEIYNIWLHPRSIEVPVQGVSKLSRLSQALAEEPDYEPGRNIEFTFRVPRYGACIAADSKNLVKHLQVFGFEIGRVDFGRHVVLLSVWAKRIGPNRQRPFHGYRELQLALNCGR